jgi:Predicted AAA-ATPase/PD-(D/E)XK nuclease superfamily
MKNLPIGFQNLSEIVETNSIYVDKTPLIHQMVTTGKYYFLSRPRRFGKSLTVSVLKELFEGNKILFKDLWIEKNWDWSKTNPVIRISFTEWDFQNLGLSAAITEALHSVAQEKGIILTKTTVKSLFRELIHAVYQQAGQVVLLIDEYDKPIVQYLEDNSLKQAIANRKILKNFYSVLKDAGKILRFVFITGISKFTRVSIFSDLNHLTDLTLHEKYAALTGYTQQELEHYFNDYLNLAAQKLNISRPELLKIMKEWYNGYSWDGVTTVYNPFGTLSFLANSFFKNYWFSTGTPTFLLEQMKKQGQFVLSTIKVDSIFFEKYDLEDLDIYLLLFQTGYLTVQKTNPLTDEFWLGFPNKEVHDSFFRFLVGELTRRSQRPNSGMTMDDLRYAFENRSLPRVKVIINAYLAELPESVFRHSAEGLYHGLVHIIFTYLGTMIQSEVHSSYGQADAVVQTDTDVFIFEFKFNESADAALAQIKEKAYADKYQASGKTITGIGVNFKLSKRVIDDWKTELF